MWWRHKPLSFMLRWLTDQKFQLEQGGWWLTYVQQIQKTFHKCEMKTIIIWSIKTISRTAQGSVDYQVRESPGPGTDWARNFLGPRFLQIFGPGTTFWKKSSFGTLNSRKCSRTKSYKRDSCPHLVKRLEKIPTFQKSTISDQLTSWLHMIRLVTCVTTTI